MARTHAAPARPEYGDAGVLLGKGGEPIPTTPTRGVPTLNPHGTPKIQHMDDGELIPPPPKPAETPAQEFVYICDRSTWQRNMDGYQALHLLDAMLGGLSATLTHEQMMRLKPDVRWHLKKIPKPPEEGSPP